MRMASSYIETAPRRGEIRMENSRLSLPGDELDVTLYATVNGEEGRVLG
jgi:hypothetical protein